MNGKTLKKDHLIAPVFIIAVFVFCLLWYVKIYPLSILAVDDWTYISYKRLPFPLIKAWNPIKVFPEIYMPLMGKIGAFIIYPITKDYLWSITLALGLGVSIMVTLYIETFRRLLTKVTGITNIESITPTLLFLLLHFTIFLSDDQTNNYLLGADAPINHYNYMITALLNFSIIFTFESMDSVCVFFKSKKWIRVAFLLFLIYLAMFSNLFSNIILATYSFSKLFLDFTIRRRITLEYIKHNILYLLILALWATTLLFEFQGGRSNSLRQDSTVLELVLRNAHDVKENFFDRVYTVNISSFLICLVVSIGTIVFININKSRHGRDSVDSFVQKICILALICSMLTMVFIYLLCTVTNPGYCDEPYVWIAFMPWLFIVTVISLSYLCRRFSKTALLLPLIVGLIIVSCSKYIGTFNENTVHNLPPEKCVELNQYVMKQVFAADANGQTEMTMILPVANRENLTTFSAPFHGERIIRTMYYHNLIHKNMKVNIERSYEVNELFQVDEDMRPMQTP